MAAVGADVDAARIGIFRHHAAGGADVASAVLFVMDRHGKFREIDFVALRQRLAKGEGWTEKMIEELIPKVT